MAARGEDREGPEAAEGPEAPSPPPPGPGGGVNVFANDGSFLELFKRKMEAEEQQQREREAAAAAAGDGGGTTGSGGPGAQRGGDGAKRSGGALGFVGRRRGGNKLALKTGVVAKKQKTDEEVLTSKGDAWAKYLAEVQKYKAHQCSDDDKTRPLVK
ncbi:telomerase RNA component interacting RNase [Myiozetetes cayanensis]|uniref:telomerase RNA component interacting RNase n=1 Tax=Empidonax traillii TaxID=164674 RepID=UPI000FFCF907|nr:telomerase RNA component interacting RNase [Empidonax traillii]XP_050161929.1 telomerase RNA component interacting RNase [Myiozetetes cayanensis]